ncbi:hypothetical protein BpHYR1_038078 [Brachionus plicatilis]|uniref:Uncharacterized protein n=1 Tax=Brachionus plicatilis TaxID=10195 RepID=A0A3M7R553_BRAPC|nr:hypothetical protein BpHYR1_038078 [Brachionus plicatilis]
MCCFTLRSFFINFPHSEQAIGSYFELFFYNFLSYIFVQHKLSLNLQKAATRAILGVGVSNVDLQQK